MHILATLFDTERISFSLDKSKANEVHYIEFSGPSGDGSAWVQTRGQLKEVLAMLRGKPGMEVKVETHLIPRDKTQLVGWLNAKRPDMGAPVATQSFTTADLQAG